MQNRHSRVRDANSKSMQDVMLHIEYRTHKFPNVPLKTLILEVKS